MFFPDKHPGVLYIPVSINLHIGNDMDKVHCCGDSCNGGETHARSNKMRASESKEK